MPHLQIIYLLKICRVPWQKLLELEYQRVFVLELDGKFCQNLHVSG